MEFARPIESLKIYREYLLGVLEDVTDEQANDILPGFRNTIRWNLGHMYVDTYLWIYSLTGEEDARIQEWNTWFGYGTTPENFTDATPSFEELKQLLIDQFSDLQTRYGSRLSEVFPPTKYEGYTTIQDVFLRIAFHDGLHFQTILHLKRFLSHDKVSE
ncbi:DinB family protein [Chryseomicrobium palamuruense]|uniref:DinB family protein n=1 Tax=Chryseomicrobium palamuruense TaxID=682973 RepID=A0ABV8V0D1_9BACL